MYRCPRCNSDKIETKVINEIGYLYCNKCGFRTQVNDQDGGGQTTTTSPFLTIVRPFPEHVLLQNSVVFRLVVMGLKSGSTRDISWIGTGVAWCR